MKSQRISDFLERDYFCKNCNNKNTFKTQLCILLLKAKNNILADQN